MKPEQTSQDKQETNITADSENQISKIIWQFGEAVKVSQEKKEEIDLTLPIINSTIQNKKTLW